MKFVHRKFAGQCWQDQHLGEKGRKQDRDEVWTTSGLPCHPSKELSQSHEGTVKLGAFRVTQTGAGGWLGLVIHLLLDWHWMAATLGSGVNLGKAVVLSGVISVPEKPQ